MINEETFKPDDVGCFRYVSIDADATIDGVIVRCRYALDDLEFEELIRFETSNQMADLSSSDAQSALRLVYLLAGVSYYKAAAPPVIAVDSPGLTPAERRLLEAFYTDGLGEYAYRNLLDLSGVVIEATERSPVSPSPEASLGSAGRPLIPFGGGIDSIVTVEGLTERVLDPELFVVSRAGDRFAAIENAASVTGLPVRRAERRLDDKILRSSELGFRNGHVPVTGIISAIATAAAVLGGNDAVVMSNEWSASAGNLEWRDRSINHQWSKSLEFEDLFRSSLSETLTAPPDYYSWLRPFSELWVAHRLAGLDRYHLRFRSCNRSFHIDPSMRLDHWCGTCDKCCFINLILAPFLSPKQLGAIFEGSEPLENGSLLGQFRNLAGLSGEAKPFECVGDEEECRVAVLLASRRADRAECGTLRSLADEVRTHTPGNIDDLAAPLLAAIGEHRVPERHAPNHLLV